MSPRPLPAQLAAAAFLAASLGDPAAFAQTTLPKPPAAIAPVSPTPGAPSPARPTLPPGLSVNGANGQIQLQNPGGAGNFATGQFGYTPGPFNAPLNVTPPPKILPAIGGIDFTTTPAALSALISGAARAAAAAPGYATLTAAQKSAAVQAAIAEALSRSAAKSEMLAAALASAVQGQVITAEDAVALSSMVSADLGQQVRSLMFDKIYLPPTKSLITASINTSPVFSILTSLLALQGAVDVTPINPAAYDPCAGVIAAYCG